MFVSKLAAKDLNSAIFGHLIDSVALCPSSVFVGIPMAAASHVHARLENSNASSDKVIDVGKMQIFHPRTISSESEEGIIRVAAVKTATANSISVSFSTQRGSTKQDHARCIVSFQNADDWKDQKTRISPLVQHRVRPEHSTPGAVYARWLVVKRHACVRSSATISTSRRRDNGVDSHRQPLPTSDSRNAGAGCRVLGDDRHVHGHEA